MRLQVFTHDVLLPEADLRLRTRFEPGALARDFRVECGAWEETGEGLLGASAAERAAVCWHRGRFPGNVVLRLVASTVPPHARDIICYWRAAGSIYSGAPNGCYVGAVGGWWAGKPGLERHPEGGWVALGAPAPLEPGRRYELLAGSVEGWQFLFVDGRLAVEAFDPAPLAFDRIGLATWASRVLFHELEVWLPAEIRRGRGLAPDPA